MIPHLFSLANIKAKPLKIGLMSLTKGNGLTDVITYVRNWAWYNIIDTKLGWHDNIQCVIDDIDVEQLMNDKAEDDWTSKHEAMD